MLPALHTTLRRLLHERGGLDPEEIEIHFERPTRQWADSLLRPAVNLFLFDVEENTDRRAGGPQMNRNANQAQFRVPPRYFDVSFLVGAFATVPEDEQALLWRSLATLLRFTPLPAELLPEPLAGRDLALSTQVGRAEQHPRPLDIWGGLDLPPRPALILRVSVPLDLEIEFSAPLVLSRSLRVLDRASGGRDDLATRIGGTIRDQAGHPLAGVTLALEGSSATATSDDQGRYSLRLARPGTYTVFLSRRGGPSRQATLVFPSASYDLVVNQP